MTPRQVFVREATGLVREIGFLDAFLINMAIINVAGGLAYDILQIFFFPGASLALIFVLGGIPAIGIFITYTILSSALPRTGGDYVFTSRILHPALGFASGIMNAFGFFLFSNVSFMSWFVVNNGTPALMGALSVATANPSFAGAAASITSNVSLSFALSTLLLLIAGLLVTLGLRVFRWAFRFIFIYYFLSAIVLAVALLSTNHEAFVNALNTFGGPGAYQKALTDAGEYGVYTFSWSQTLLASVPLGFLTFTGFQVSTYLGGETKNPRRTQAMAMGVAMLITWIYLVVLSYQSSLVFGDGFLQAVGYLWGTNPSLLPLSTPPSITFLVSLVYPNAFLAILLNSAWTLGTWLIVPVCLLGATRIVFAQSFDRTLPEAMSRVNEKLHSPLNTVLIMFVFAEIWLVILYFYGFILGMFTLSLAAPVAWSLTAISAMLFPYVKRDLYEDQMRGLPTWMRAKPLGIPLLTIGGTILLVAMAVWIGAMFSPSVRYLFLGPLIAAGLVVIGGILVFSFLWYYAIRAYRLRREGVDISQAFKEIPPE